MSVIYIKDLFKSFGTLDVLKGVELNLEPKENLAVLGKSGSGKSVLIKIIAGLISPDKGHVEVLGKNLEHISKKELEQLRLKLGFCFQNSALYDSMTINENILFPLKYALKTDTPAEMQKKADQVLEAVGLLRSKNQMPSELSGGQKKRIGIARTVVMNPEIILYDEPTSGLDPITCVEVNELILRIKHEYDTSAIIITHDLTCAKHTSDRISVLLDGYFKKTGKFDEVFNEEANNEIKEFYNYNFIK
jgi:phospholipid/cholesterol/gamma-HCH transport system ATP-binding protein